MKDNVDLVMAVQMVITVTFLVHIQKRSSIIFKQLDAGMEKKKGESQMIL